MLLTDWFHRSFAVAVTTALWLTASTSTSAAGSVVVPASSSAIQVQRELRPDVDEMLRVSPTFRLQYERIAQTSGVFVSLSVDPTLRGPSLRARSTIRRYRSGLLIVAVGIGPGTGEAQWIAHEFEHILEQLDGWNLPSLAERGPAAVWHTNGEMFETGRAVRAGRVVLHEMRGQRTHQDKLVE